jgi:protein SCO1
MSYCRALAAAALATTIESTAAAHGVGPQGLLGARADDGATAEVRTTRSRANYVLPDVQLVRDDGKTVRLRDELDGGRSVVLSFIFTACTSICPVTSATFAQLQRRLGAEHSRVQLISISIDPDEDGAERLAAYGRKFGARPGWRFYTGTAQASIEVQRAFDAYGGDKMRHTPDTYIRRAGSQSWVRLHGFASADELLAETGVTATPR